MAVPGRTRRATRRPPAGHRVLQWCLEPDVGLSPHVPGRNVSRDRDGPGLWARGDDDLHDERGASRPAHQLLALFGSGGHDLHRERHRVHARWCGRPALAVSGRSLRTAGRAPASHGFVERRVEHRLDVTLYGHARNVRSDSRRSDVVALNIYFLHHSVRRAWNWLACSARDGGAFFRLPGAGIALGATADRRSGGPDDSNRPRLREERVLNLEAKPRHWHPGRFALLP